LNVVFRWLVEFGHIELSLDWTIHGLNNLAELHPLRMGLRFVVEVRLRDGAGQIHLSDVQSDTLKKLSGSVCHEVVLIGLKVELSSPSIDVKLVGLGSETVEVVLQVRQSDHHLVLLNTVWNQLKSWSLLELFVVLVVPYLGLVVESLLADVVNLDVLSRCSLVRRVVRRVVRWSVQLK